MAKDILKQKEVGVDIPETKEAPSVAEQAPEVEVAQEPVGEQPIEAEAPMSEAAPAGGTRDERLSTSRKAAVAWC